VNRTFVNRQTTGKSNRHKERARPRPRYTCWRCGLQKRISMTNNLRRPPAHKCNFLIVPIRYHHSTTPYAIRIDQDICQQANDWRATHMTNYGLCSLSRQYRYMWTLVLDPDRSPLRPLMMHDRRWSEAPFDRLQTASSVKYSPSKQRPNTRHRPE